MSAVCEDGAGNSHAGAFTSVLNVDCADETALQQAINTIFASYPQANPEDQVMVQVMVQPVAVKGNIMDIVKFEHVQSKVLENPGRQSHSGQ